MYVSESGLSSTSQHRVKRSSAVSVGNHTETVARHIIMDPNAWANLTNAQQQYVARLGSGAANAPAGLPFLNQQHLNPGRSLTTFLSGKSCKQVK